MNRGNRPRNRQPRQQNNQQKDHRPRAPRDYNASVPTVQQVTPGASVSIVLKQDQPTGREVQGTVQDLLTRGNHPRGIKVRLTDGRVGRVQRMAGNHATVQQPSDGFTVRREGRRPPTFQDMRNEEFPSEPPPRTLLDFLPEDNVSSGDVGSTDSGTGAVTFSSATAKCPICNDFEGDEAAVTHHVEGHLA